MLRFNEIEARDEGGDGLVAFTTAVATHSGNIRRANQTAEEIEHLSAVELWEHAYGELRNALMDVRDALAQPRRDRARAIGDLTGIIHRLLPPPFTTTHHAKRSKSSFIQAMITDSVKAGEKALFLPRPYRFFQFDEPMMPAAASFKELLMPENVPECLPCQTIRSLAFLQTRGGGAGHRVHRIELGPGQLTTETRCDGDPAYHRCVLSFVPEVPPPERLWEGTMGELEWDSSNATFAKERLTGANFCGIREESGALVFMSLDSPYGFDPRESTKDEPIKLGATKELVEVLNKPAGNAVFICDRTGSVTPLPGIKCVGTDASVPHETRAFLEMNAWPVGSPVPRVGRFGTMKWMITNGTEIARYVLESATIRDLNQEARMIYFTSPLKPTFRIDRGEAAEPEPKPETTPEPEPAKAESWLDRPSLLGWK